MADVLEVKRKHYSGLDADKAGITGTLGDTYAANDSGKAYYWNDSLSAWKTGLGYEFVPRSVVATDKTQVDFTLDGTFKVDGLDLSGIVPAGAVQVRIRLYIKDDAADKSFTLRANATTKVENVLTTRTQVANVYNYIYGDIDIDPDRLLDYAGSAGIDTLGLYVTGWYI